MGNTSSSGNDPEISPPKILQSHVDGNLSFIPTTSTAYNNNGSIFHDSSNTYNGTSGTDVSAFVSALSKPISQKAAFPKFYRLSDRPAVATTTTASTIYRNPYLDKPLCQTQYEPGQIPIVHITPKNSNTTFASHKLPFHSSSRSLTSMMETNNSPMPGTRKRLLLRQPLQPTVFDDPSILGNNSDSSSNHVVNGNNAVDGETSQPPPMKRSKVNLLSTNDKLTRSSDTQSLAEEKSGQSLVMNGNHVNGSSNISSSSFLLQRQSRRSLDSSGSKKIIPSCVRRGSLNFITSSFKAASGENNRMTLLSKKKVSFREASPVKSTITLSPISSLDVSPSKNTGTQTIRLSEEEGSKAKGQKLKVEKTSTSGAVKIEAYTNTITNGSSSSSPSSIKPIMKDASTTPDKTLEERKSNDLARHIPAFSPLSTKFRRRPLPSFNSPLSRKVDLAKQITMKNFIENRQQAERERLKKGEGDFSFDSAVRIHASATSRRSRHLKEKEKSTTSNDVKTPPRPENEISVISASSSASLPPVQSSLKMIPPAANAVGFSFGLASPSTSGVGVPILASTSSNNLQFGIVSGGGSVGAASLDQPSFASVKQEISDNNTPAIASSSNATKAPTTVSSFSFGSVTGSTAGVNNNSPDSSGIIPPTFSFGTSNIQTTTQDAKEGLPTYLAAVVRDKSEKPTTSVTANAIQTSQTAPDISKIATVFNLGNNVTTTNVPKVSVGSGISNTTASSTQSSTSLPSGGFTFGNSATTGGQQQQVTPPNIGAKVMTAAGATTFGSKPFTFGSSTSADVTTPATTTTLSGTSSTVQQSFTFGGIAAAAGNNVTEMEKKPKPIISTTGGEPTSSAGNLFKFGLTSSVTTANATNLRAEHQTIAANGITGGNTMTFTFGQQKQSAAASSTQPSAVSSSNIFGSSTLAVMTSKPTPQASSLFGGGIGVTTAATNSTISSPSGTTAATVKSPFGAGMPLPIFGTPNTSPKSKISTTTNAPVFPNFGSLQPNTTNISTTKIATVSNATATNSGVLFGSSVITTTTAATVPTTTTQAAVFSFGSGAKSSPLQPIFGGSGGFGAAAGTMGTDATGTKIFATSAKTTTATATTTTTSGGFVFGSSSTIVTQTTSSSLFGGGVVNNSTINNAVPTATTTNQQTFKFGASGGSMPSPFGSTAATPGTTPLFGGSNNSATTNGTTISMVGSSSVPIFGSSSIFPSAAATVQQTPTQPSSGLFNFGGSSSVGATPTHSIQQPNFQFGGTTNNPSGGFTFGASASAIKSPTPTGAGAFSGGSSLASSLSASPASGGFNFGASASTLSSGGTFNFGGSASASPSSMGTTPIFSATPPPTGTPVGFTPGSSKPKAGRNIARARRRK